MHEIMSYFWYLMKWKYSGVSLYGQSKVKVEINHYDKTSETVDIFSTFILQIIHHLFSCLLNYTFVID